jgi:hypothetical protein
VKTLAPLFLSLALLGGAGMSAAESPQPPLATAELADRVLNRGLATIDLGLDSGARLTDGTADFTMAVGLTNFCDP